jgi:hypothetical protein
MFRNFMAVSVCSLVHGMISWLNRIRGASLSDASPLHDRDSGGSLALPLNLDPPSLKSLSHKSTEIPVEVASTPGVNNRQTDITATS